MTFVRFRIIRIRIMSIDLILQLHRATHRVGLFLAAWKPPLETSQAEAHILAFLSRAGICPIGAVQTAFAHKRSTLTGVLDRLEARGWVQREDNPSDRRSFLLKLTPDGKKRARQVSEAMEALGQALAQKVSARDRAVTLRCLTALEKTAEQD